LAVFWWAVWGTIEPHQRQWTSSSSQIDALV
jgi:hypothetical protein